jgi:hypothetical protein
LGDGFSKLEKFKQIKGGPMKETLLDLENLLDRGMELTVWKVPATSAGGKAGLYGAKVYNPDEIQPNQLSMWECLYAPTVDGAITKAVKEER